MMDTSTTMTLAMTWEKAMTERQLSRRVIFPPPAPASRDGVAWRQSRDLLGPKEGSSKAP